jgi:hypothetical protein
MILPAVPGRRRKEVAIAAAEEEDSGPSPEVVNDRLLLRSARTPSW